MNVYKVCSDCRAVKPVEQFHTDKNGAAMVRGNCAQCETAKARIRMRRIRTLARRALVTTALLFVTVFGRAEEKFTPIVDKTIDSVVQIVSISFHQVGGKKPHVEMGIGMGAGVLISTNGHILTCEHVVDNAFLINVTLHGSTGSVHQATVIRRDFKRDIAVLKLVDYSTPTYSVRLAPQMPRVGDEVIAIGHPFDRDWSVTTGIISGLHREGLAINLIQTDAAINPGNSGGPLFNLNGEVVGLNQSVADANSIGFSVSVAEIREFLSIFRGLEQVF